MRIIVAILFWKLAYSTLSFKDYLLNGTLTFSKAIEIFCNSAYHLWFLYMIIGLYMIAPLLQSIAIDNSRLKYFLVLSFTFGVVFPFMHQFSALRFSTVTNFLRLEFVTGYSFYFMLGYFLHKTRISQKLRILIYLLGLFGVVLTVVGTDIISELQGKPVQIFYQYLSPNCVFSSIAVFIFAKELNLNINHNNLLQRVSKFSSVTFGIYLIHIFTISLFQKLDLQ